MGFLESGPLQSRNPRALRGIASRVAADVKLTTTGQNSIGVDSEAGLLIIPSVFTSTEHPREILFQEQFVCMVWRDSPLARGELSFDRYVDAEHVIMQPTGGRADAFEAAFLKRRGIARSIAVTTYSFVTLPALVTGTSRIATVHSRIARRLVRAWPLEIRPMPMPFDPMEEAMQWHRFRSVDPGLVWLRDLLSEAARRIDEPGLPGAAPD